MNTTLLRILIATLLLASCGVSEEEIESGQALGRFATGSGSGSDARPRPPVTLEDVFYTSASGFMSMSSSVVRPDCTIIDGHAKNERDYIYGVDEKVCKTYNGGRLVLSKEDNTPCKNDPQNAKGIWDYQGSFQKSYDCKDIKSDVPRKPACNSVKAGSQLLTLESVKLTTFTSEKVTTNQVVSGGVLKPLYQYVNSGLINLFDRVEPAIKSTCEEAGGTYKSLGSFTQTMPYDDDGNYTPSTETPYHILVSFLCCK